MTRFFAWRSIRLAILAALPLAGLLILPLFLYLLVAGAPQEGTVYVSAGLSAFLCGSILWYLLAGERGYLRGALAGALTGALFQIPAWSVFMVLNFSVAPPPLTTTLDSEGIREGAFLLALPVVERTTAGFLLLGGLVGLLLVRVLTIGNAGRSGGD